jgi:hypothetical protein
MCEELICKSADIVSKELLRSLAFRRIFGIYCGISEVPKFVCISQFLVELITMFCGALVAKHRSMQ